MTPAAQAMVGKVRVSRHQQAETRHQTNECNGQQCDVQAIMKQWVHLACNPGVKPRVRDLNGSRIAVQPAFREDGRPPGR